MTARQLMKNHCFLGEECIAAALRKLPSSNTDLVWGMTDKYVEAHWTHFKKAGCIEIRDEASPVTDKTTLVPITTPPITRNQLDHNLDGIRSYGRKLLAILASLPDNCSDGFDKCRSTSLDKLRIETAFAGQRDGGSAMVVGGYLSRGPFRRSVRCQ